MSRRTATIIFICSFFALVAVAIQQVREQHGVFAKDSSKSTGIVRHTKEPVAHTAESIRSADAFQQAIESMVHVKESIESADPVQLIKESFATATDSIKSVDPLRQVKESVATATESVRSADIVQRVGEPAEHVNNSVKSASSHTYDQLKEPINNAKESVRSTSSHAYDKILDKIAIGSEEIQSILHLATQKQADAGKHRSFTTKLFAILFPSSKPAINALLATAYISGPPNFLLALCPPNIDPSSLSVMVAFAVGGLLGDTFFHLLPEIFLGEDSSGADSHKIRLVALEPNRNLLLGVFIFIGLATFMAMDKGLRIATGGAQSHSHDTNLDKQVDKIDTLDYRLQDDLQELARTETKEQTQRRLSDKPYNDTSVNGQKTRDIIKEIASHNEGIRRRATDLQSENEQPTTATTSTGAHRSYHSQITATSPEGAVPDEPRGDTSSVNESSSPTSPTQSKPQKHLSELNPSVRLAGLLNLVADFTHNITDGLALSTSFYSSPALGATTTMAVFFHEIPHEVGDFALLIQSGFTKRSAMAAQFVTAAGAFLGTIIGILVQEYGSGKEGSGGLLGENQGLLGTSLQWADCLLPFTAGTFLYVGTVGVIPELLENEKGGTKAGELRRTAMQFGAMAVGALLMIAISWT